MIWKMSNIYKQEELGGVVRKGNKLVDRRTGEILETTALPWKWFREEVEMVMADHPEDYIERAKIEATWVIYLSRFLYHDFQ